MPTWIKICGLTNRADAELACALGADALGFVLHPSSRRFCEPNVARAIIQDLPRELVTFGVWFDESADVVAATARSVRCKCVQCYNPNTARTLHADGFEVLPALPVAKGLLGGDEWRFLCASWATRVVIDRARSSPAEAAHGGSAGSDVWRDAASELGKTPQIVLAGGLRPDNVRMVLRAYRPSGLDVASGVESVSGRKDRAKLVRFIEEVRRCDAMVGSDGSAGNSSPKR